MRGAASSDPAVLVLPTSHPDSLICGVRVEPLGGHVTGAGVRNRVCPF